MPVTLRPVTADNYNEVIRLEVHEVQRAHVGSITEFLARAYVKADGLDYYPLAVHNDDTLVGFIIYGGALDSSDAHYIVGFLIDKRFQRQGFGRAALIQMLRFILLRPGCRKISICVHPENASAIKLYESLGFTDENRVYQGEVVYSALVEDLRIDPLD